MNEGQRIEVQRVLRGIVGSTTAPQLIWAMKRADGRFDICNRDGLITIEDNPPSGESTQLLIVET